MGICVRCGTLVCAECVTQVDGINHCVACLAVAVATSAPAVPRATRADSGRARLALVVLAVAVAIWGILEATLPG